MGLETMNKRVKVKGIIAILVLLCLSSSYPQNSVGAQNYLVLKEKKTFGHIVLVTWDGVRRHWLDALMENDTLVNLASLKSEGSEVLIRILDHNPSTDPGLACIDSGYGPDITGINSNYFGSSTKRSIPEGLATTERIKAVYGSSWKTALVMPWTQGKVNVTTNEDSTFWNQREETDYWFSSENLTWSQHNPIIVKNALDYSSALLRANYTASKLAEFIQQNKNYNFYARVHFVEPDNVGHAYGESVGGQISPKYREALIKCDEALGIIIDALNETGIYQDTVVLVTTDHGFQGITHGGDPYPFGSPEVTVFSLITNNPEVTNELGWGIQNDISPTCLALAGIDPASLKPRYSETSRAMPIWMANPQNRESNPPKIIGVQYSEQVSEGETFNITVTVQDESGILSIQVRYFCEPMTIWITSYPVQGNGTTFSMKLGPFNEGTKVRWYLRIVDNSTGRNVAYYPVEGSFLNFTIQKRPPEKMPPFISQVQYSGKVFEGESFNVTVTVQDESGIFYVRIHFLNDTTWKYQNLAPKNATTYTVSLGPFVVGTEVKWYIEAMDLSPERNVAYYPTDRTPLNFTVKKPPDRMPPVIFGVQYTKEVYEGGYFNVTVTVQDESGILYVRIQFINDTVWRYQNLAQKNATAYMGRLGPLRAGTKIRWYIEVADLSPERNVAYYPTDKTPLNFTVREKSSGITPEGGLPIEYLIYTTVVITAVGATVLYKYLRRRELRKFQA